MTSVSGLHPWERISEVSQTPGPKKAAFAFVGMAAPDLLALGEGDVLICNASLPSVEAGSTSPRELLAFHERGVRVFSNSALHAKMLATTTCAVIGSANASHRSDRSLEAVVISEEMSFVRAVDQLIDEVVIDGSAELTLEALETLLKRAPVSIPSQGKGLAGVTSLPAEQLIVPDSGGRYWLDYFELSDDRSAEVRDLVKRMKLSTRARVPAAAFELDSWLNDEDLGYQTGDVVFLFEVDDGGKPNAVWEPAKIVDIRDSPDKPGARMVLLSYPRGYRAHRK